MKIIFQNNRYRQGMTLVELVVVIAVYVVLMGAIMSMVTGLYNNNAYTMAQAREIDTARRGIQVWTQDAREMLSSAEGAWPIAIMEPHRMAFYSDVDRDETIELVIYTLASTTLYKYTYEPTGSPPTYSTSTPNVSYVLSEFVQNLTQASSTFLYYDTNGAELSVSDLLTDVRYIRVGVIVNIDPIKSPGEFMLRASAAPRNLKDNL